MKKLKIKDSIDLKELEKLGFVLDKYYGWKYEYKNSDILIKNTYESDCDLSKEYEDINIVCFDRNRYLYIHCNTHMVTIPKIVYDLIKADLVEVVDE